MAILNCQRVFENGLQTLYFAHGRLRLGEGFLALTLHVFVWAPAGSLASAWLGLKLRIVLLEN